LLCDSGGSGGSDGGSGGGSGASDGGESERRRLPSGPLGLGTRETKMFGIHREIAILAPQNAIFFGLQAPLKGAS